MGVAVGLAVGSGAVAVVVVAWERRRQSIHHAGKTTLRQTILTYLRRVQRVPQKSQQQQQAIALTPSVRLGLRKTKNFVFFIVGFCLKI